MRLHRFYTGPEVELKHDFWLRDTHLLWQWRKVLRYKPGQEIVLFDGSRLDRLYKLESLSDREAHLIMVTELKRKVPAREVYLLFSMLKKDKNDWVLQKGTEVGVRHFIPILADRSEKTGFNLERSKKIVIEAAEQCERSDIPAVREPLEVSTAIKELKSKVQLWVAEKTEQADENNEVKSPAAVFIGPEGGWSDREKELFKNNQLAHLNLHDFNLRAETAAVAAVLKLLQ